VPGVDMLLKATVLGLRPRGGPFGVASNGVAQVPIWQRIYLDHPLRFTYINTTDQTNHSLREGSGQIPRRPRLPANWRLQQLPGEDWRVV
jgi:hypothetical protein